MTVLLLDKAGLFLLYHVEHTIIKIAMSIQMLQSWLNKPRFRRIDYDKLFLLQQWRLDLYD